MSKVFLGISLLAIFGGLFAQKSLGTEFASMLIIGGAIVGCLGVFIGIASWFKK